VTTEIDRSVENFLAERGAGEVSVASRPELAPLAGELNSLWWHEVEKILHRVTKEGPDRAVLSPDERLLIDQGVLDWRLLPGGDKNKAVLLKELYASGPANQYYLSEWILQRFRLFLLYGGMSAVEGEGISTTRLIRDLRGRLYTRLSLLFKNLPGFNQQSIDLFLNGRIDETLDSMTYRLKQAPDERLAEQRRQIAEIRNRMIARARERARTPDELALFDALRQVDREAIEKRVSQRLASDAASSRTVTVEEREAWVQSELKFVKQVLWLGVTGSGLARTYSVLLSAQQRIVKADLDATLALAEQCDPMLPEAASILIAPYAGGGFYEWDRDTLFVPLVPTREPEQAVLQALANYRILLDKFHDNGKFKKEYETALEGGDDFGTSFARDYRAWVNGVGKGFKGALDPARFAFFRDRIGPQAAILYAPRGWVGRTPKEQEEIVKAARTKVSTGEARFEDFYRLAIVAYHEHQPIQATQHLQSALRLSPVDGRALLALGLVSMRTGGGETAKQRFAECMSLAPGTLWSVYAGDELQKL
jgi:tetratricopeptide (TPR) repeat protein